MMGNPLIGFPTTPHSTPAAVGNPPQGMCRGKHETFWFPHCTPAAVGKHPLICHLRLYASFLQVFLTCHHRLYFSLYFFFKSLFCRSPSHAIFSYIFLSICSISLFYRSLSYILQTLDLYMEGPQTQILHTKQEPQFGSPSFWRSSNGKDKSKGWEEMFIYKYGCYLLN